MSEFDWRRKARDSVRSHSLRSRLSIHDFRLRYGWKYDEIAVGMRAEYETGQCPYCHDPYKSPEDVTVDVLDPNREPFYKTNTKFCCMSCNSAKRNLPPMEWEKRLNDKSRQLPLFVVRPFIPRPRQIMPVNSPQIDRLIQMGRTAEIMRAARRIIRRRLMEQ